VSVLGGGCVSYCNEAEEEGYGGGEKDERAPAAGWING